MGILSVLIYETPYYIINVKGMLSVVSGVMFFELIFILCFERVQENGMKPDEVHSHCCNYVHYSRTLLSLLSLLG